MPAKKNNEENPEAEGLPAERVGEKLRWASWIGKERGRELGCPPVLTTNTSLKNGPKTPRPERGKKTFGRAES